MESKWLESGRERAYGLAAEVEVNELAEAWRFLQNQIRPIAAE